MESKNFSIVKNEALLQEVTQHYEIVEQVPLNKKLPSMAQNCYIINYNLNVLGGINN